jgi:hypothetical protein
VALGIDGTATPGADYDGLPSGVTIPAGQTSVNLTVRPYGDAALEDPFETVIATVRPSSAYVVGSPSSATASIVDHRPAGLDDGLRPQCSGPAHGDDHAARLHQYDELRRRGQHHR